MVSIRSLVLLVLSFAALALALAPQSNPNVLTVRTVLRNRDFPIAFRTGRTAHRQSTVNLRSPALVRRGRGSQSDDQKGGGNQGGGNQGDKQDKANNGKGNKNAQWVRVAAHKRASSPARPVPASKLPSNQNQSDDQPSNDQGVPSQDNQPNQNEHQGGQENQKQAERQSGETWISPGAIKRATKLRKRVFLAVTII